MLQTYSALAQPVTGPAFLAAERRHAERHASGCEATSHALDAAETIAWGAVVRDVSTTGVGLTLCFPFKPGTYLSLDLKRRDGQTQGLLVRVVHVRDQSDGSWQLGCEFVKPLGASEVARLL